MRLPSDREAGTAAALAGGSAIVRPMAFAKNANRCTAALRSRDFNHSQPERLLPALCRGIHAFARLGPMSCYVGKIVVNTPPRLAAG